MITRFIIADFGRTVLISRRVFPVGRRRCVFIIFGMGIWMIGFR